MNKHFIIFTDLDGTLLDSHYSFRKAKPALKQIKEKDIPLLVCSSKTRPEIEHYRKKLHNDHPFISENGGGIFIPKKSEVKIKKSGFNIDESNNYFAIRLGASYDDLRGALKELHSEGFIIRGFGDMSVKAVSELTGLKMSEARLAKKREFDEPFVFKGRGSSVSKLKRRIKAKGFNYTEGEFFHIMGDSDKGRAVDIMKKLYTRQYKKIVTIALGDSPNDIEMLQKVDYPIVVQKGDGSFHPQVLRKVKSIIKADGIGPEGWNRALINLLKL